MPTTVHKCPFSKEACKGCPIYRGRHGYIVPTDGETPPARVLKWDDSDWQGKFKDALKKKERVRTPKPSRDKNSGNPS